MITVTDVQWKALFAGEMIVQFDNLGLSMMVMRLQRNYKKDPGTLEQCIQEANSFCEKYENLVKNDLAKIFK